MRGRKEEAYNSANDDDKEWFVPREGWSMRMVIVLFSEEAEEAEKKDKGRKTDM